MKPVGAMLAAMCVASQVGLCREGGPPRERLIAATRGETLACGTPEVDAPATLEGPHRPECNARHFFGRCISERVRSKRE